MKKIILTTIALVALAGTAHASCGPRVSLGLSHNVDNTDTVNSIHTQRDQIDSKVDLTITWNLGEDYCTEQEFADLQKKKADEKRTISYAKREEVRQLKEMLALCAKYPNSPLLAGKCGR